MKVALRFISMASGEQCATIPGRLWTQTSSVVSYLIRQPLHIDRAPSSVKVLVEFGSTMSVARDSKLSWIIVFILD